MQTTTPVLSTASLRGLAISMAVVVLVPNAAAASAHLSAVSLAVTHDTDQPSLEARECTPVLGVDPDTLDFGEVPLYQEALREFLLTNEQPDPTCELMIVDIQMESGTDAFAIQDPPYPPILIYPGLPVSICVRFVPTRVGLLTGVIAIGWYDPPNIPPSWGRVRLLGEGVGATGAENSTWGSIKQLFR